MTAGGHMTPDAIAAYLDGGLSADERESLERHMLVCPDCRRDLAEASELQGGGRTRSLAWAVPALAAAAALVLWLGLPSTPDARSTDPVLRGAAALAELETVSPEEGAIVDPDSLTFRWRDAGESAHYVFTLTDGDGDVVFSTAQADTTLVLPRSVGLEPGARYFWLVDALLDGARSTTTGFREFALESR